MALLAPTRITLYASLALVVMLPLSPAHSQKWPAAGQSASRPTLSGRFHRPTPPTGNVGGANQQRPAPGTAPADSGIQQASHSEPRTGLPTLGLRLPSVRRASYQEPAGGTSRVPADSEQIPLGTAVDSLIELPEGMETWESSPGPVFAGGVPADGWYGNSFFRAEYLLWRSKGNHVPALVTTSPLGTIRDNAGVLGLSTTSILFGNGALTKDAQSGIRLGAGYALNPCWTLEATYVGLEEKNANYSASSNGSSILARPFYNLNNAAQDAVLLAYPNFSQGSIQITTGTEFQMLDLLARRHLLQHTASRLDLLFGFRFARLRDNFRVNDFLLSEDINTGVAPGTTASSFDRIDTENEFSGALIGLQAEVNYCQWRCDFWMKLGLGTNRMKTTIDGGTTFVTPANAVSSGPGGLLALPSNMGDYRRNQFTMIPEVGFRANYEFRPCWQLNIGYTLVYWGQVMRTGDQIDTVINTSQFPIGTLTGAPFPEYENATNDFWTHGLTVGIEYEF